MPIIQGYCKITHCENTFEVEEGEEITDIQRMPLPPEEFEMVLISRRSIRRAGTHVNTVIHLQTVVKILPFSTWIR